MKTTYKMKTTKKWKQPYIEDILKNENNTKMSTASTVLPENNVHDFSPWKAQQN